MDVCLDNMRYTCDRYTRSLPTEVPTAAAQGAIVTIALHLCVVGVPKMALLAGGMAVTATVIQAIIHPIFVTMIPDTWQFAFSTGFTIMTAVSLGEAMAPWLGVAFKLSPVLIRWALFAVFNYDNLLTGRGGKGMVNIF